jgi:plastocyanin
MNATKAIRGLISLTLVASALAASCSGKASTSVSTPPVSSMTSSLPVSTPTAASTTTSATVATTTTSTPPTSTTTTTFVSTTPVKSTTVTIGPYTVIVQNQTYTPGTLNVTVGTTVTWINKDADDHTATSDTGSSVSFDLLLKGNGGSNTFTFTKAGSYAYHCNYHSDMHGIIVVT